MHVFHPMSESHRHSVTNHRHKGEGNMLGLDSADGPITTLSGCQTTASTGDKVVCNVG